MEYRQISENYSVSAQIAPEDVEAIKAAGFRSVICNRPDDEQPGQPSHDVIKAAVEGTGLAFRYIPVISGQMSMDNVEDQAEALDELEGPVLAFCRSGARCTNLYALVQERKRG
ncbi:MAG: TIGR01244 family phosphatase [Mesorhizobium sp.]|nr:TIGR01244 family sulfur transferase [Mesorhizobium sp.]MBN9241430.1 TIGR01244 family phosphatase [Mesorhizobium sp.]MBN9275773.1 TIGR01244 family phosphatase [Mesorhizobium sp.]